jgi:hypothetical protein
VALFKLLLFVLLGISIATMFSGFMLARRMGYYLMTQVMMLMLAMFVSIGAVLIGLVFPYGTIFDLLHIIILVDFVFVLLASLMEFIQVVPILLKTMQGAPIHSSHISNLLVYLFLALGMVLFYTDLALI